MSTEHIEQHTAMRDDPGRLLATAISINAAFSSASGLVLLLGAPALTGPFGVQVWLLASLGTGLLAFAGLLLWSSRSRRGS